MGLPDNVERILISEGELSARVAELAGEVEDAYAEADRPLFVCVLKGAFVFLADLVRQIQTPHEVDFMEVASYGSGTTSSGVVRILLDLERNIQGRHVLIVEDIVDSGRTLTYIMRNLRTRGPASLRVCALLTKPARRECEVDVDLVGFEIPDEFVVGYGLDYAQVYRNLPFIAVLKREAYAGSP